MKFKKLIIFFNTCIIILKSYKLEQGSIYHTFKKKKIYKYDKIYDVIRKINRKK